MTTNIKNQLHCKLQGEGEPIILIGGLNVDHTFWFSIANELSQSFKLVMPDNRGVGSSQIFEPECTTELMAEDIINLLDDLNIDTAHVMGHSLGGCIAQQLAIKYPERVNKLILCSTQCCITTLKRFQINTTLQLMQSNIPREFIVKQVLSTLYSDIFFKNESMVEQSVKFALSKPVEQSKKSYFYQINALLNHNTTEDIKKIKSKTLVIGGEEDISVLPHQLKFLADNIVNAKIQLVPHAAHMLPIENPKELSQVVSNFLEADLTQRISV